MGEYLDGQRLEDNAGLNDQPHGVPVHAADESGERLETLSEISRVVSSTLDLRALYETIYLQVSRVMDTTQFFIALAWPERGVVSLPYYCEEDHVYLDDEIPYGPSVTTLVMEQGTSLLFHSDEEYQAYVREHGLPELTVGEDPSEAKIWVPLNTGHTTLGALSVQSTHRYAYTEADVKTLSIIAAQAAVAIENARLFLQREQRVHELQTIHNIIQNLTVVNDVEAISAVLEAELARLIDYHTCRLFLVDSVDGTLIRAGFDVTEPGLTRLRPGEGITGWIASTGRSASVPNTLDDARSLQIAGSPTREESLIGAPLIYEGRVQGVITLTKLGRNRFDENELRLLEIVAAQAAIAIDRARLYDDLRLEARTDPLTKLYNRRYLMERFREVRRRCEADGSGLAVVLFDFDEFKHVNDAFGHDAGDRLLQTVGHMVLGSVRVGDVAARYGGEEFCVLLVGCTREAGERLGERIRSLVAERDFSAECGQAHATVSVGVAFWAPDDHDTEVFTRADLAMYAAKRSGGNRVCVAPGRQSFLMELA